jgi:hypothetical protein
MRSIGVLSQVTAAKGRLCTLPTRGRDKEEMRRPLVSHAIAHRGERFRNSEFSRQCMTNLSCVACWSRLFQDASSTFEIRFGPTRISIPWASRVNQFGAASARRPELAAPRDGDAANKRSPRLSAPEAFRPDQHFPRTRRHPCDPDVDPDSNLRAHSSMSL